MVRKCPICRLDPETRQEFDSRLAMGIPASSLAEYLKSQGCHVSIQQVYSHKKHSKPKRYSDALELSEHTELVRYTSEGSINNDQRQERLLQATLESVDSLLGQFKQTNNLRVARMLKEMGELARQLLNDRLDREKLPEPNISVIVNMESLEEHLGLEERWEPGEPFEP
ncbi:hypothetical protein NIES4103_27920 [Nostoc sp. NIES-4103]|nr:hypothetical protein NIES4103_27920 [Nostoc sp. NIES-4103]